MDQGIDQPSNANKRDVFREWKDTYVIDWTLEPKCRGVWVRGVNQNLAARKDQRQVTQEKSENRSRHDCGTKRP